MRTLLLTVIMIFTSSAFAGLYKWVDDEGNVHYSQKRPRDQQFQKLKAPPPAPEDSKALYQSSGEQSKSSEGGNDTSSTETAKNNKIREQNCTNAKKNLNAYQVYRRIKDKDGNVKQIDDKVRATQIKRAQQAIKDFCN